MKEFEKVIGYESIKKELMQICDMMHNMDLYEKLGAKMSKGFLLHGVPGVGKSLLARCFLKESGRKTYTIHRDEHDVKFIDKIRETFEEAKKNAPSVILLDDMDKFVVKDKSKQEYVVIQSCIDKINFSDVYIIATANDLSEIPESLLRCGRFDRKISINIPIGKDSEDIIKFYLKNKVIDSQVNINDVAKMLSGKTCADIETIINESAILAGYERSSEITMEHIVNTVLKIVYGVKSDYSVVSQADLEKTAYHEAGHIVMSEVLDCDKISIASLCRERNNEKGGFVSRTSGFGKNSDRILMCLAGKCACELKFGEINLGAQSDLRSVIKLIEHEITYCGSSGIGLLDVHSYYKNSSNFLRNNQETAVHIELEKYMTKAKEILIKNNDFLEFIKEELLQRKTLLNSDIKRIREQFIMTEVD